MPKPSDWQNWDKGPWQNPEHWQKKQWNQHRSGCLFVWFVLLFGLIVLLVLGGMGVVAWLFTRGMGGDRHIAVAVWMAGCGVALALPLMALFLANRAFRGIAAPLAEVMKAADEVAAGNLGARVHVNRSGPLGQLGRSFNHMTEELERADQQRRQLTTDVAHELRTPLHIIQGNLEGVLDGVYEPSAEHIQSTLEETHLLARLIEDLRVLSLAESGHLPLQQQPVQVGDLLSDVATSFSGQAEAKGVALITNIEGNGSLTVRGDADRLDQVLGNLLVNGIRHTPSGGSIYLSAKPANGDVVLQVADTGEGISAEDLPHIFDRFWRGDRARTHAEGVGGGLGLAIVRQLVLSMGGTITAESDLGRGTTFSIRLPRLTHTPALTA